MEFIWGITMSLSPRTLEMSQSLTSFVDNKLLSLVSNKFPSILKAQWRRISKEKIDHIEVRTIMKIAIREKNEDLIRKFITSTKAAYLMVAKATIAIGSILTLYKLQIHENNISFYHVDLFWNVHQYKLTHANE